jgi:osmoprotectant transport system substrate-binding protein
MKRNCCAVLVALLVMSLVLPGCFAGQTKPITIAAQDSTESYILTAMARELLTDAGYRVNEKAGMKTADARAALMAGNIDACIEYTGVAWTRYLHKTERISDAVALFNNLRQADLAANGIEWVDRMNVDSSSALVISKKSIAYLGTSISTLVDAQIASHEVSLSFRVSSESLDVPDGFRNMEKWYITVVPAAWNLYLSDSASDAADELYWTELLSTPSMPLPCIAMMPLTEPKIRKFGFVALKDDKGFFPVCNPAFCIRKDVLAKDPRISDVLKPLTATLTQQDMITLNYEAEIDGLAPREVAARYLREKGLIN